MEVFIKYKKNNADKKGELKSNLTVDEQEGLESLMKRFKSREIIARVESLQ